jgi:IstB-like ATP binding protein
MKKGAYKQLNLTHLEAALPHVLDTARREQWTYETLLERALAAEVDGREQKSSARRLKAARIPGKKTLDGFDFSFQPTLSERRLRELADLSDVANLYQCGLSRPSWDRQNTLEPGVGGSSARSGAFRVVYAAFRARTGPGKCVTSWSHAAASAALYRAQSAGHRRSRLHQAVAGAGSPLL